MVDGKMNDKLSESWDQVQHALNNSISIRDLCVWKEVAQKDAKKKEYKTFQDDSVCSLCDGRPGDCDKYISYRTIERINNYGVFRENEER